MIAGLPLGETAVPAPVARLAADRPVRRVWENQLGGLTFEVGAGAERCFVKWTPHTSGLDLRREVARMVWAAAFTSVPRVLDEGGDGDGSWIVTAGLPGESAIADRWRADPATAVTAIGRGLRDFHDALPVDTCPFSWSVEDRLVDIRDQAAAGLLKPARWESEHQGLEVASALRLVAATPPIDKLVVCHGDTCAPNTLLTDDGHCSGHVDLGSLGVADRWADLAVATWSLEWNYSPGWDGRLLDAYGIDPDPERTRYYRLLWDLDP